MSREQDIRNELDNDVDTHGYAAIIAAGGDQAVTVNFDAVNELLSAELNLADIDRNKAIMTRLEILAAIDDGELLGITNAVQVSNIWGVIASHLVDPFGLAEKIFIDAFPPAGVTLTALNAARVEQISRATEIGFGLVKPGHVGMARNLP